jgi:hypothetical protein
MKTLLAAGRSRRPAPTKSHLKHLACLAAGLLLLLHAGPHSSRAQDTTTDEQHGLDLEEPTGFFEAGSLHSKYSRKLTYDQYVTYALRSISLVAGFDNDLHRYDSQHDLINSFERNLTYGDDLSSLRAHIDSSETDLLQDASELTLIENELNQATCAQQLDYIFEEALKLYRDYESFTQSKRLDLIDFFDSYGSAPSEQFMMGNAFWLGSFEQCRQARIEQVPVGGEPSAVANVVAGGARHRRPGGATRPANRPPILGRYCVAHMRLPSWQRAKQTDKISLGSESIKLGVCLPRVCNSISMLRHSNRIESVIRLARLHQVPYSNLRLMQLYCLPDENSPLRQFSPSARLFIGVVSVWLLLVVYASAKYELARARRRRLGQDPELAAQESRLVRVFAFRYACQRLFCDEPASKPAPALVPAPDQTDKHVHSVDEKDAKLASLAQLMKSSLTIVQQQPQAQPQQPLAAAAATTVSRPNLSAIDGIKVISMIWLVSAHTMLFFIRTIANGRQFWSILLDVRFMTIMAGIFPVDSFFTVTGVLTSYLKFNRSRDARRPMTTLAYWLEIFVHRYLRFMPMYLLIFWYTRDLSEFIGHGPMWDYATAATSLRSICKRESLWVPILFQANFKPIEQHCVKPAWYLANDYQYLLITPIFMLMLLASKWLGYLAIGFSVLASLVMQFLTVYQPAAGWWQTSWWWWWWPGASPAADSQLSAADAPFTDFEALINFRPMFATYVLKDLWRLYVLPYNRIPPYLIGLLTGHLMYRYAKRQQQKLDNNGQTHKVTPPPNSAKAADAAGGGLSMPATKATTKAPSLGSLVGQHVDMNIWTPVALLLAVVYLPMSSLFIEQQTGERAKIGASLIIALMRFVWSLSIARLIYVCFTGSQTPATGGRPFVVRLLSSPKWRPWSKICLSVLLIQWEVISYLAQIQPVQSMTFSVLLTFVITCIFVSYAIGLLIYLLFEFPLSQIEQLYIAPKLFAAKPGRG